MGRLFDAIASLLGLCHRSSFEGQAAMQLEYAIAGYVTDATYSYRVHGEPLQFGRF
jgi:hydrogenase maturation protein HypF